jgi:hypothetical protein
MCWAFIVLIITTKSSQPETKSISYDFLASSAPYVILNLKNGSIYVILNDLPFP